MPRKAYLEITNACNLHCDFCHGTSRPIRYMGAEEFERAATELRGFADYLYLHVMGEPLLHPRLGEFFEVAHRLGFRVIVTTNGTLLQKNTELLLNAPSLFKVSVSLHSFESNAGRNEAEFERYLTECFTFCDRAAERGMISVLRLWNLGGEEELNERILSRMHDFFDHGDGEWKPIYSGFKLRDRLFLEWGERFDWPDIEAKVSGGTHSCYGLRDQVGVLSDGTVVPCCLDADGVIALGNIFTESLSDILSSPRAVALKRSFETRSIVEPLCLRCGYAASKRK